MVMGSLTIAKAKNVLRGIIKRRIYHAVATPDAVSFQQASGRGVPHGADDFSDDDIADLTMIPVSTGPRKSQITALFDNDNICSSLQLSHSP